jgi:hypothetical protein
LKQVDDGEDTTKHSTAEDGCGQLKASASLQEYVQCDWEDGGGGDDDDDDDDVTCEVQTLEQMTDEKLTCDAPEEAMG